jgi:hypothetical protein
MLASSVSRSGASSRGSFGFPRSNDRSPSPRRPFELTNHLPFARRNVWAHAYDGEIAFAPVPKRPNGATPDRDIRSGVLYLQCACCLTMFRTVLGPIGSRCSGLLARRIGIRGPEVRALSKRLRCGDESDRKSRQQECCFHVCLFWVCTEAGYGRRRQGCVKPLTRLILVEAPRRRSTCFPQLAMLIRPAGRRPCASRWYADKGSSIARIR